MKLTHLPIAELKRCPIQLRPVKKETLEYYQLRDSIRKQGLLAPLLVRQGNEVVDGNHRFEVLKDLKWETAPCYVLDIADEQVHHFQVIAHENRIPASNEENRARIQRIIQNNPELTVNDIAYKLLHKHPDWIRRQLHLDQLVVEAPLIKAIELVKLPKTKQHEFAHLSVEEIQRQARLHRQSVKDSRIARSHPTSPKFRTMKEILDELEHPTAMGSTLLRENAQSPLEIWTTCLKWITQTDSASLEKRS